VAALSQWVEGYFRDGLREAGTELSIGERRIRLKARRISLRGPLGGAVISLEDVTDELRTERILAWGEMAQQVAHEVKNPLTPIKLGVQHIRRAWEGKEADFPGVLNRNVEVILGEIDRLASVATSFSRFAAPSPAGEAPLEAVGVADVVGEVLDLYRAGGGPVSFSFRGKERIPLIRAREGELKEVLVNLLENARAALPDGGRVDVEADEIGSEIELRVRDDGTGIPPELFPRIFEPHFSTRASGTGLGLAIVRRLVDSWGGRVQAESEAGTGTVITLRLQRWGEGDRLTQSRDPSRGSATPSDS
jgi:nitrogen fixation/metabolism regulation signal transduction histidine kinase